MIQKKQKSKSFLLVILFVVLGIVALGIVGRAKNTQTQKKLELLAQEVQLKIDSEAIIDSNKIINFINQTNNCPPVSPHSKDLSEYLISEQSPEKIKAKKYPELDFSKSPIFILDNTLYFAEVDVENSGEMKLLETISPKLAQKMLSCYFENKNVPQITNFKLEDFKDYKINMSKTLELAIERATREIESLGANPTGQLLEQKKQLEVKLDTYKKKLGNIDYQVGGFSAPVSMMLIMDKDHNSNPDRYLATLIHEHVHFVSYSPNKKLDRFWFDGLADYFTREVLENVGRTYSTSYIVPVEIVTEMTKDIPEDTFKEFLFSNDQASLAKLIDSTYGSGFYEKHRQNFEDTVSADTKAAKKAAEPIYKDMK